MKKKAEQVFGWHFVPVDANGVAHLNHRIVPRMSLNALDALEYTPYSDFAVYRISAPASVVADVAHGVKDKLDITELTVVAMLGTRKTRHVIVEWAMWCAEQALALVDNPDPRSIAALATVKRWLKGETTQEELDIALAAIKTIRTTETNRTAAYAAYAIYVTLAVANAAYVAYAIRAAFAARAAASPANIGAVRAAQNQQLGKTLLEAMGLA